MSPARLLLPGPWLRPCPWEELEAWAPAPRGRSSRGRGRHCFRALTAGAAVGAAVGEAQRNDLAARLCSGQGSALADWSPWPHGLTCFRTNTPRAWFGSRRGPDAAGSLALVAEFSPSLSLWVGRSEGSPGDCSQGARRVSSLGPRRRNRGHAAPTCSRAAPPSGQAPGRGSVWSPAGPGPVGAGLHVSPPTAAHWNPPPDGGS